MFANLNVCLGLGVKQKKNRGQVTMALLALDNSLKE